MILKPFPKMPALLAIVALLSCVSVAQDPPLKITVHWDKVTRTSQTTPTLQVVVNPPLQRGTPVHDNAFKSLHDLGRRLRPLCALAALSQAGRGRTGASERRKNILGLFFHRSHDHRLPRSYQRALGYSQLQHHSAVDVQNRQACDLSSRSEPGDLELRAGNGTARSQHERGRRLLCSPDCLVHAGWFTDEFGKRHESGYHYSISHWEVLNEVDFEHHIDPETYTRLYDETVTAMKKVQPDMKFVGLALAMETEPRYFEYFLDHKNHKPGVPLDFISYHFYAVPTADETPEVEQFTYFDQAEGFLKTVRYVEAIRKRLSPETKTTIDELGVISADDTVQDQPGHVAKPIENSYWHLAGAMYAYLFGEMTKMGIDVAGESQLVGFPTQFPSVSMVDWNDGKPNARYWVLKLLHDNFGPGDKLVEIEFNSPYVYSQAVVSRDGKKRVLLVNKRNRAFDVSVAGASGGQVDYVDQTTGFQPPASAKLYADVVKLNGFAVAVVTVRRQGLLAITAELRGLVPAS